MYRYARSSSSSNISNRLRVAGVRDVHQHLGVVGQARDGPVYRKRGGARVNYIYATWPFAQIGIGREEIRFRFLWNTYKINREDIQELRFVRGITSRGLVVIHSSRHAPADLIFWTFSPQSLIQALGNMDYEICEG